MTSGRRRTDRRVMSSRRGVCGDSAPEFASAPFTNDKSLADQPAAARSAQSPGDKAGNIADRQILDIAAVLDQQILEIQPALAEMLLDRDH